MTKIQKIHHELGYIGEQLLSFMDELYKVQCPSCGEQRLSAEFVGQDVLIRCSRTLNDTYEHGTVPGVCGFTKLIHSTNLNRPPFTLKFEKEKTATKANRSIRRRNPKV